METMVRWGRGPASGIQCRGHARLVSGDPTAKTRNLPESTGVPPYLKVVGWQGFEPWTNGLKGRCSTTELPTHASDDGSSKGGSTKQRSHANRPRNHAQAFSRQVGCAADSGSPFVHSSFFCDTFSSLLC